MSMISEQIKIIREVAQKNSGSLVGELLIDAADTIEDLSAKLANANMERSTAYYNDGWIPCSEKLPEESGYYMACIYDPDVDDFDFRKTWFAHADDYGMEESGWIEPYDFETVTAWMPLPAPYQPKGE